MRITRRLLPTVALTAALAVAVAAPAAASGHSFSSDASGAGLELTVADQTVTIGSSEVHLERPAREDGCDDDIVACAEAAGAVGLSESATASAPGDPGPNSGTAFSSADALPGS